MVAHSMGSSTSSSSHSDSAPGKDASSSLSSRSRPVAAETLLDEKPEGRVEFDWMNHSPC